MLAKTGLVVISNPTQISRILRSAQKQVKNMLYVQLMSNKLELFGGRLPWPSYSQTIKNIYSLAASDCSNLDVRVLLSTIKYDVATIKTHNKIDLVIFDREYNKNDVDHFLKQCITNINKDYNIVTLQADTQAEFAFNADEHEQTYSHTVLGGTFDRLHLAHKVLLSEAALRSKGKVTVGVTEENMLDTKILWELIEPIDIRIKNVHNFLTDICPELKYDVTPIEDAMGPTKSDATMQLLVVSAETSKGGTKVNDVREENNLPKVEILAVELIDEPLPKANEETKISSSTGRLRLLGSLLKPVNSQLPKKPYIIGLTGGIASGKSGVATRLAQLGAHVINCDQIGHQVYTPGTECYKQVVAAFGDAIVAADGTINRQKLGPLVFGSPERLAQLNGIVWPAIGQAVAEQVRATASDVIVIEAAVLLTAQWENMCHEVWTTMVKREEAVRRIQERNKLSAEQALQRIASQPPSEYYVSHAHVVMCTLWDVQYTHSQVDKAWDLLQQRIPEAYIPHESKY